MEAVCEGEDVGEDVIDPLNDWVDVAVGEEVRDGDVDGV